MGTATQSRRPHLETVVEFEMEPEPAPAPERDPGERAERGRLVVMVVSTVLGVVVAGSVGAGLASPPASPTEAPSPLQTHGAASCRPVATTASTVGDPHMRCTAPDVERARAHGPGAGTDRRWSATDPGTLTPP
jgi:hypothetical protein